MYYSGGERLLRAECKRGGVPLQFSRSFPASTTFPFIMIKSSEIKGLFY